MKGNNHLGEGLICGGDENGKFTIIYIYIYIYIYIHNNS